MWIRFAEGTMNDGENSPHIDIDICGYTGPGDYTPFDPLIFECSDTEFDIWWHDGPQVNYANAGTANPCLLTLEEDGDELHGTFDCTPLLSMEGGRDLSVSAGAFRCLPEPG